MQEKIALLLQKHYIAYCKEKLENQKLPCKVQYFEYQTLEELQEIFIKIKNEYDGFITSGTIPKQAIREVDTEPYVMCQCFGGYLENTYRILLSRVLKRNSTDSTRIGMDYLEDRMCLEEVLENDQLFDLIQAFEKRMEGLTQKELKATENLMVEKYRKRAREGKLDFVVTYFYSVVEAMKEEGIECYYSYPSVRSLLQVLNFCVKTIQLEKVQRRMSAVIRIRPYYSGSESEKISYGEITTLKLKGALLDYCREHLTEPVMKDDLADIELYLNKEQVQHLTEDYKMCDLAFWIKRHIGMEVIVGVGLGTDLQQARIHAVQALEYTKKIGRRYIVCIDEKENIRKLFLEYKKTENTRLGENDYIKSVANQVHLSAETVLRVVAATQMKECLEITASDLVQLQNFSTRVANRVLAVLEKEGYAKRVGEQRCGNKGRPQKIYQIKWE